MAENVRRWKEETTGRKETPIVVEKPAKKTTKKQSNQIGDLGEVQFLPTQFGFLPVRGYQLAVMTVGQTTKHMSPIKTHHFLRKKMK